MFVAMDESATSSLIGPPQDEDIPCPLCGYNMRGLTEARCPECGAKYEWLELREARDKAPIFEYRGRAGSLIGTAIKTLSPVQFWRTLRPAMPPNIDLLTVYAVAFIIASIAVGVLIVVFNEVMLWLNWTSGVGLALQSLLDGTWFAFFRSRDYFGRYLSDNDAFRYALFTMLSMPMVLLMLFVSLCLGTLQKAKLRLVHIVRVALYCSTPLLIGGLLSMFAVYINEGDSYQFWFWLLLGNMPSQPTNILALPILLTGVLGTTFTLGVACRRYLQVRHAWGVACMTGLVLSLWLFVLVIGLR